MEETNQPDLELVSDLYDTILTTNKWSDVMNRLVEDVDASSSILLVADDANKLYECKAASQAWTRRNLFEYTAKFYRQEIEAFSRASNFSRQQFISDLDIAQAIPTYNKSEIDRWLDEKINAKHRIGASLHWHNAWTGVLTLQFNKATPFAADQVKQYTNQYLPHFAKAVEIARIFSLLQARYDSALAALDRFKVATTIVNRDGFVVLKNTTTDFLIESKDGIDRLVNGKLKLVDADSMARLTSAIKAASRTSNAQGINAGSVLLVNRLSGKTPYIFEVSPLKDSEYDLDGNLKGAIVFIIDPTETQHIRVEGLQKLYQLTRAETMVCRLLAEGWSNPDIAEFRNVSSETVKSQVKSILQKTGTQNRIQLVRLALMVSPPV